MTESMTTAGPDRRPRNKQEPAGRTLRFTGGNEFQAEVRRRVEEFFRETGRMQRDNPEIYVKAAAILTCFVAAYFLLVFVADAWWQAVPLAVLMGLATAAVGFNVMHDGSHGAFSRHPIVNKLTSMSMDLIGGSSYLWRWKHGTFHHTYVNLTGHDVDVDMGRLARLTPHQPWLKAYRWQHWYVWPLYGVMAVKWHLYDDFHNVLTGSIGPHRVPRPRGWDLLIFIGGKTVFFTIAFGIPLLVHAWWVVAIFYLILTTTLGFVLSLVFQLAHTVEQAAFPEPPRHTEVVERPWAVHQVESTVNFMRGNRVGGWLLGGLNYQIEHHLFPRISHVNYPALSQVVERTCREFGVAYHEHKSFWSGLASHTRWLRRMGAPDTAR
jgi:linoleoyl-CoA desaturase